MMWGGKMSEGFVEAKEKIFYFIDEAKKCLDIECGYSAMNISFSVIMAVGEAITGGGDDKALIRDFYSHMKNQKNWLLVYGVEYPNDEFIIQLLYELRNDLSHQISLPKNVGLIANHEDAKIMSHSKVPFFISVEDFINDVKKTVVDLASNDRYSSCVMDPNYIKFSKKAKPREIGEHVLFTTYSGAIISASYVQTNKK
jgi:hypothetical protein